MGILSEEQLQKIRRRIENDLFRDMRTTLLGYSDLYLRLAHTAENWQDEIDKRSTAAFERDPSNESLHTIVAAIHTTRLQSGPLRWMRAGLLFSLYGAVEDLIYLIAKRVESVNPDKPLDKFLKNYKNCTDEKPPEIIKYIEYVDTVNPTSISQKERLELIYLARVRNGLCHRRGRFSQPKWDKLVLLATDLQTLRLPDEEFVFEKSIQVRRSESGATIVTLSPQSLDLAHSILGNVAIKVWSSIPDAKKDSNDEPQ